MIFSALCQNKNYTSIKPRIIFCMHLYEITLEWQEIKLATLIRLILTRYPMLIWHSLSFILYPSNDSFDSLAHAKIVNKRNVSCHTWFASHFIVEFSLRILKCHVRIFIWRKIRLFCIIVAVHSFVLLCTFSNWKRLWLINDKCHSLVQIWRKRNRNLID